MFALASLYGTIMDEKLDIARENVLQIQVLKVLSVVAREFFSGEPQSSHFNINNLNFTFLELSVYFK